MRTRESGILQMWRMVIVAAFFACAATGAAAQNPSPKATVSVKLVNEVGLKEALKIKGRPMVVNFWATWCDPCREEFPDLVKIYGDYKDRIDMITVSLDDPAEINRDVKQFLGEMNATMPALLLRTADEGAVISSIAKGWSGGLPFTVIYDSAGTSVFLKQGKFKPDVLRAEIDKLLVKKEN